MTQTEASGLRGPFAEWISENTGFLEKESSVAVTADTAADFENACIEIGDRENDSWDGRPVLILRDTQRRAGEPRKHLIIADLGTHRLVSVQ